MNLRSLGAVALGVAGLAVASIGAAVTPRVQPPLEPQWYPLALVATALPCTWIGKGAVRGAHEG
jgi:hypothetical protein